MSRLRGETVDRGIRDLRSSLQQINALEPEMKRASDAELRQRGEKLRQAVQLHSEVVVEGVALVREVGYRVLGLRLHDVQAMAAVALCQGKIVELGTGEGKTLAAVAPAWLNSLTGDGVHVLTFNDYLARRDAAWMGPVHEFLGSSVGCIQDGMGAEERRHAYAQDGSRYGEAILGEVRSHLENP